MFAHKFNELKTLMLDHLQTSGNITCEQLASALGISIQNVQISILRLRRQSLVTKESLPRGGMVGRKKYSYTINVRGEDRLKWLHEQET